jgi:hypothetical protein
MLLIIQCVIWSLRLLFGTFFIIRRTERDLIKNIHWSSCKVAFILLEFYSKSVQLFHADGQTEIAKLLVAFRNFAKAPKKNREFFHMYPPTVRDPALRLSKEREPYLPIWKLSLDFYDNLLTAIGLSPCGSTHLHTNNTWNNTNNSRTTQITTNVEECGLCTVFESFTLAFALQLRKKHGKTSVRVRKTFVGLRKPSVRVQYTY